MSGYKQIPAETKEQVLERVKQGIPVVQISSEHGISPKTIYGWLSKISERTAPILELVRLKKERDDLLKIIGKLTLELTKSKKGAW